MKKFLITIDWFYPAYKAGGPITSMLNFVKLLSREFQFFILTSDKDLDGKKLDVPAGQWLKFQPNVWVFYASSAGQVLHQLRSLQTDGLIVNGIFSPVYSILPLFFRPSATVIFPRDMISEHSLAIKPWKKQVYLSFAKRFLYKNVVFWATSEFEYQQLKRFLPGKRLDIVPNFVSDQLLNLPIDKTCGQVRLVTISRISRKKNLVFAAQVLNRAWEGEILWDIYGPVDDQNYLARLQEQIQALPSNVRVRILPAVRPEQIRSVIAKYHYFYFPTSGENFGHVIFESFAASRPVIISNRTPWRDLADKGIGWDLELNLELFQKVIDIVLNQDAAKFQKLTVQTFNFAKHYIFEQQKLVQLTINKLKELVT